MAGPAPRPPAERFWPKVDKTDSCWLWKAGKLPLGYGVFCWNKQTDRSMRAHRAAWLLCVGEIPDSVHVLHRCDTPACVNPAHLFLGTQADNMRDMAAKRRWKRASSPKGTINGNATLSEAQVMQIRHGNGFYKDVMREYGISQATIYAIRSYATWKHLP